MKVNDGLYILELPVPGVEGNVYNLSLIVDRDHGLSLVDTGVPGQADAIDEALAREGFSINDVKQIVITHQDLDHIGSLHAVKERSGAQIYAFADEAPYIEGALTPIKMPTAEQLAQAPPEMADRLKLFSYTPVDVAVHDGQVLEKSGGAVVVATPGHTPGHMSLYLPGTKTLIAGDALMSESGALRGPLERATPDLALAMESVKKLAALDVETIVCYHGGLVAKDASAQLKRVANRR